MSLKGVMIQYFIWDMKPGFLWNQLKNQATSMARDGFTSVWIPPCYKGENGIDCVGYSAYDLWDLGEFPHKTNTEKKTKYGSKEELELAIKALHTAGLHVYADIVFNHKIGADEEEWVTATRINPDTGCSYDGKYGPIKAWTKFTFPGRNKYCPKFEWNWKHFDTVDFGNGEVYLLKDKTLELKGCDHLMGCDIDFDNKYVRDELERWGRWFLDTTDVDGFRFDAVKHVSPEYLKYWLNKMKEYKRKNLFAVGEHSGNLYEQEEYINKTGSEQHLFDFKLRDNFVQAAREDRSFDLRKIFDGTLTQRRAELAVTFLDNHDTQKDHAKFGSPIPRWFRPIAYAFILLRIEGYPCVFYADYFNINDVHKKDDPYRANDYLTRDELAPFLYARRKFMHGRMHDQVHYNPQQMSWTYEGNDNLQCSGLAVMISTKGNTKVDLQVGYRHAGREFFDCTGNVKEIVAVHKNSAWGLFEVNCSSVSVWIPLDSKADFEQFKAGKAQNNHVHNEQFNAGNILNSYHQPVNRTSPHQGEISVQQGLRYLMGNGVQRDETKAYEIFLKCAESGVAEAMMLMSGYYTRKLDYAQALYWCEKAASPMYYNNNANLKLGDIWASGQGVMKDDRKAFEYYLLASKQGNKIAMCKVAECYYYGRGTTKDELQAYNWLKHAKKMNHSIPPHLKVILDNLWLGFRSLIKW